MTTPMPPGEVARRWRPGSGEWSWAEEFANIMRRQPDALADLVLDVARQGIQEPVLLGDDGRVWDGHHRILAALLTNSRLPATFGFTKPRTMLSRYGCICGGEVGPCTCTPDGGTS